MKCANISKGLVLGLSLLLATSVFAANNKGSLQLTDSVTVNGKTVPAGDYSVKWEGTGSNVQLNILKGSKVVATAPAHIITLGQSAGGDSAVLKNNNDGSKSLSELRFSGKKQAIQISEEGAMEAGGASR